MLKNTGRSKAERDSSNNSNTHFSYDDYRSRVNRNSYKDLIVFASVLIIGVLIFLGFAKILSPNVDVEIADKEEYTEFEDDNIQGSVDERLKHIKSEDETNISEIFTPELDEAVVLPSQSQKTISELDDEMQNDKSQKEKIEEPVISQKENKEQKAETKKHDTAQQKQDSASAPVPVSKSVYRVVVGSYSTEKQAEVAKSIMQDSGLGVTPIIKNIGGSYTLQVGVYSSNEKAQQSVNSLLKNNFPARIAE